MGIGNIGWTEFIVILAFALIFFGPRRLPGIANTLGRSLREFQKALNEVRSEIAQAGRDADVREAAHRTDSQRPGLQPGPQTPVDRPRAEGAASEIAAGTAEPPEPQAELTPDTATGPVATAAAMSARAVADPREARRDAQAGDRAPRMEVEGDRNDERADTARTEDDSGEDSGESDTGARHTEISESPRTPSDPEGTGAPAAKQPDPN